MASVAHAIEVDVPITVAYNQWTQFESFPEFMNGVVSIDQRDDTHTHWKTSIGGIHREFDAEIVEQRPDERIAWHSVDGTTHSGLVTFEPLGDSRTRVVVILEWEPEGVVEKLGAAVAVDDHRVSDDLRRFKEFIEQRRVPTGAWRGEVELNTNEETEGHAGPSLGDGDLYRPPLADGDLYSPR